MTDTQARRRALLSLLDQYPLERDLYLYEGRREVSPRDEFADKIEALFAPSLFEQVMTASERYVTRFGGRLTEEGTVDKFNEESAEFSEAITDLVIFNQEARDHLLEEFVDVMVTAGGIFAYYGIKWNEIETAARAKLKILTDRKAEDYVWHEDSKTVIKRSKLEAQS